MMGEQRRRQEREGRDENEAVVHGGQAAQGELDRPRRLFFSITPLPFVSISSNKCDDARLATGDGDGDGHLYNRAKVESRESRVES